MLGEVFTGPATNANKPAWYEEECGGDHIWKNDLIHTFCPFNFCLKLLMYMWSVCTLHVCENLGNVCRSWLLLEGVEKRKEFQLLCKS